MKLTCVTATWNVVKAGNREALIRCVESVSKIKTPHEHLVYDGASTDGTVELLRDLEARTPGLKVVTEPDTGIYNALNKGIRDARGEWFYVLGCDDYIEHPTVMDRVMSQLSEDCDVFATSVSIVNSDGKLISIFAPNLSRIYDFPCACHQGEIMRTSVARALNGFDEQYRIAADSDLFLRAHLAGYKFKYATDIFATFTGGGASSVSVQTVLKEHRTSVANALYLTGRERRLMIDGRVLSFRMCKKLWNHRDEVIRNATRAMVLFRARLFFRKLFYPIIVLTRPFRHAIRGC